MRADAQMGSWLSSLHADARIVICTIVRGEILFGLERLEAGQRRNNLETKARILFQALPCEPVPALAADAYAVMKAARQRRGLPLDENDLWIAATAMSLDAILVTRDRHFQDIEGLTVVAP